MANRIQLRRDTAANWARVNPVLEDGEPGLEIDTNYVKYGDGNTAWADLAYASTGGGGDSGNITFTYSTVQEGTVGPANVTSITGGNNTGVSLTSEEWAQLMWVPNTANVTIADIGDGPATYNWAYVDQTGFRVESNVANVRNTWTFHANSLLTTPGNVQVGNVATYGNISFVNTIRANNYAYANGVSILVGITGGSANIGDITFDGIKIIGANIGNGSGDIKLVPDNTGDFYSSGQYVHIYPTRAVPDSPHIHIDSGYGGDLILGNDQRGVDINHDANVYIRTDQYAGAYNWRFGADGNLALPNGTRIDASTDGYGIGLTTDRGTILFGNRPEIGQLNHFHIMKENTAAVDLFFGDDSDYVRLPGTGNVEIGAGGSAWTFGSNSNLSLPYGVGVIGAIETSDSVDLYGNSDAQYVQINYNNTNFVYVDGTGAHMQAGPSAPGAYEIFLSTDGSTTFPDHKPVSITGNLTVGNLIVNGNTTTINTTSYSVTDNIVQFAVDNPADTLDLGFIAHRTVSGNLQHTGLIRDASAGLWKLFSNVAAQPGNTVDFTDAVYDDLIAGNVTVTSLSMPSGYLNFSSSPAATLNGITFSDGTAQTTAYTGGGSITVDNFTGNGSQTSYTLSVVPLGIEYTMVSLAGTLQPRTVYSLTTDVLTFSSAPPSGAVIEVTILSSGVVNTETITITNTNITTTSVNVGNLTATSITANNIVTDTLVADIVAEGINLTVDTLTANSVINGGSGTPTLQSDTSIELSAATVVRIPTSPLQFYNCTSTVRDTIAASNGYVIYNTTSHKLQVYANGSWVDLH